MITGTTQLLGIIGHPIDPVRVPMVFNERFAGAGVDAVSVPLELDLMFDFIRICAGPSAATPAPP